MNTQQPDQYLAADLLLKAKVLGADGKIFGDVEDLIMNEYNQVKASSSASAVSSASAKSGSACAIPRCSSRKTVTRPSSACCRRQKRSSRRFRPTPAHGPPKSFLQGVTERAKELAAKTSETTKDAYEKAKTKVGPALKKAQEEAGKAYEKAKEATKEVIEKAKEATRTETELSIRQPSAKAAHLSTPIGSPVGGFPCVTGAPLTHPDARQTLLRHDRSQRLFQSETNARKRVRPILRSMPRTAAKAAR